MCVAATGLTALAAPIDSDTLVYLSGSKSGGTVVNEATAADALTIGNVWGTYTQYDEVAAATLCDGVAGEAFANTASLGVNSSRVCIRFSDPGRTSYCHGSFTFECVFKTTSTQTDGPYIFYHQGGWMLQFDGTCSKVWLKYPGWTARGGSPVINDGQWHHLAVVQDLAAGVVDFYVDYSLVSRTAVELGASPSNSEIVLGAFRSSDAALSVLNSRYDEVRLTKRALAPGEFLMSEAMREAMIARTRRNDLVIDADTLVYVPFDTFRFVTDHNVARERNASLPVVDMTMRASTRYDAPGMPLYDSPFHDAATLANATSIHFVTNDTGGTYGSSGYLAMTSGLDYLKDDFTLEIFVKADNRSSLLAYAAGGCIYVFDQLAFYLRWEGDGRTRLCAGDWNGPGYTGNIVDGKWHHLAAVWEQERKTFTYYVDHAKFGSYTCANDLSGYAPTALYINTGHWNAGGNYYNGGDMQYDEFRLTRRALKATEFLSQRQYPVDGDTLYYKGFEKRFGGLQIYGDIDLPVKSIVTGNNVQYGGKFESTNTTAAATLHSAAQDGIAYTNASALYIDKLASDTGGVGGGYILTNSAFVATDDFTFETFFKLDRAPTMQSYFLSMIDTCYVYVSTEGKLMSTVSGFSRHAVPGGTNVVDGVWHHLAAVYEKERGVYSVYLDYRLLGSLDGCETLVRSGTSGATEIYIGGFNRMETAQGALFGLSQSFTQVWLDDFRLTARALKPTEFLTAATLATEGPLLYARYETSWTATGDGPYAVAGEPSGAAALTSAARTSWEIRDAQGETLFADAAGLSLAGGTVSYRGNGAFDAESATAEAFVRGRATSPDANVIAFAAANDLSAPVWAVSAGGTVTVRTAADGRTFALSETLADGAWHHLAVSYAPAGGDTAVKVWVDYACAIDATVTGRVGFPSAAGFVLGSEAFTGMIDEFRVSRGVHDAADLLYAAPPRATIFIMR